MLKYQIEGLDSIPFKPENIFPWIKKVITNENRLVGNLFYHFCSDEFLYHININFLGHDFYTDIITFPLTENDDIISGEIFISVDRIRENASHIQTDLYSEFARVMVHGVLHLLGYDDHTAEQKREMRAKEDYYLSLLPLK